MKALPSTVTVLFPEEVYVGVAPDYIEYVLPFACSARYQQEARLRVALMVAPEPVTFSAVSRGDLDFVITGQQGIEHESLDCERVYNDRMFIVAAPDHPLTMSGELTLEDLVGQHWAVATQAIEQQLGEIFEEHGLPRPHVALTASSAPLRVSRVATSRLLGVHSVSTLLALAEARAHLTILPVRDLVWQRPIVAACRSIRRLPPVARKLISDMKAIAIAAAR